MRAEALVLSIALRNTGCYLREVDIPYVIEHLRDETFTCSVLSGGDERADRVTERCSSRVQHRCRRNVAAISHKGVATNLGVPVAALPVSKRSGEHSSEVVVVGHVRETKSSLELVCQSARVLPDKNVVHNVREGLLGSNASEWCCVQSVLVPSKRVLPGQPVASSGYAAYRYQQ